MRRGQKDSNAATVYRCVKTGESLSQATNAEGSQQVHKCLCYYIISNRVY